jgi:hypothetical protein
MDLTKLELDIAFGIAATVRAQTIAAPMLDRCMPGMVGEKERQDLQRASADLVLAASYCRAALDSFTAASKTLGAFTNEAKWR